MPDKENKIIVGRFGAAFGLKGWIKVITFTNPPENILDYHPWWVQQKNGWEKLILTEGKLHGRQVIVKLPTCEDCDQARLYTNKNIAIDAGQLPTLSKNEYYWADLVGLAVSNKEGEDLGTVDHVMATGANDVLVVVNGEKERLIPFIKDVVITVDIKKKKILVDWQSDF